MAGFQFDEDIPIDEAKKKGNVFDGGAENVFDGGLGGDDNGRRVFGREGKGPLTEEERGEILKRVEAQMDNQKPFLIITDLGEDSGELIGAHISSNAVIHKFATAMGENFGRMLALVSESMGEAVSDYTQDMGDSYWAGVHQILKKLDNDTAKHATLIACCITLMSGMKKIGKVHNLNNVTEDGDFKDLLESLMKFTEDLKDNDPIINI